MSIADLLATALGSAPVAIRAYDGSSAGPADASVVLDLRSPDVIGHLLWAPGELGLARAYVSGALDVQGDLHTALATLQALDLAAVPWRDRLDVLRSQGRDALRRPPVPGEEVRLSGRRHSHGRDAAAIAHHYDVSNRFYEVVLGPSMSYTCAVFPTAQATLEEAQQAKHDLVARKLDLKPGMRLLDVGCGWGGMVVHAAKEYGVRALGVTLSRRQAEWAAKRIADEGLSDLAEVRHLDYRHVPETGFDAVSSIGLTEHIGKANLPAYFSFLAGKLRPQGRLLNHCIMRPNTRLPARFSRGFINRYVFPDGELEGLGTIVSAMQDNGFEVRHEENLREHYALTLAAWGRNLQAGWDEAVAQAGQARSRVWRLYMAGSRLAFERDRIELHQVLGVVVDGKGVNGMPLRPTWAS